MSFCPFTRSECSDECALFDAENENCAFVLTNISKRLDEISYSVTLVHDVAQNVHYAIRDATEEVKTIGRPDNMDQD